MTEGEEEALLSFPALFRPCETPIFGGSSHTGRLSHGARASWTKRSTPHLGVALMWSVAPERTTQLHTLPLHHIFLDSTIGSIPQPLIPTIYYFFFFANLF